MDYATIRTIVVIFFVLMSAGAAFLFWACCRAGALADERTARIDENQWRRDD